MNGFINEELKRNYGIVEINAMPANYHDEQPEYISWEELKNMKNIVADRIRFTSDPGYPAWELSYLNVRVNGVKYQIEGSPFESVPKKVFKKYIYDILKKENVFIKNFFDSISTLS